MFDPLALSTALAQSPRWQDLGSDFRGRNARFETSDLVYGVLIVVGAIVAVIVLKLILARQEGRQGVNSPRRLFRTLCKAHRLDRRSRGLLRQVARWQRLDHPSRLFLEPDRFEVSQLSERLRARSTELQTLRDRLFAATSDDLEKEPRGLRQRLAFIRPLAKAVESSVRRGPWRRTAPAAGSSAPAAAPTDSPPAPADTGPPAPPINVPAAAVPAVTVPTVTGQPLDADYHHAP